MAYEFNDLKGLLFLVLFTIPLTTSRNINCQGKPFHCLNSTHFMICVDLGDVSSTIDDFVIPCPPTTECHKNNHFECEFPKIEQPIPPLHVIGVTASNDISVLPPLTNSVSTTVQIEVATELPPKENNNDKDLPTLEEMTSPSKLEILENLKDEYTRGNEKFFDDSEIIPTNFTNSIYNQAEINITNSGTNQVMASTVKTYNVQSVEETFTDNLNSKALDTTISAAGLFTSRPDEAEKINKTNFQFIATNISLSRKASDFMKTTPTPYINAEQNVNSSKPPDHIYNRAELLESSDHNYKIPKPVLDIAQDSIAEMSTTDKAPVTTMNYVEFITIVDNPQITMNKDTFTGNITEINTGAHSTANERILSNQTLIETDSATIKPIEISLASSSVTSTGNSSAKDSNNIENRQLNNLLLSTSDIIPTNNRETIDNIVTTDLSMHQVTESTRLLTKNDTIILTESSLYEQNNTIKDMTKIKLTTVSVTPQQENIGVNMNTTNNQPTETSNVITILSDESKSNSSSNEIRQNASSSNLSSTKTENVSGIYLTDNTTSKIAHISNSSKIYDQVNENLNNSIWEDNATTFRIIEFNDEKTSETVSTYNYDIQTEAINWVNIGTDVIDLTTPNTLDIMNRKNSSYDGPNKKNFSDELLLLESNSKVPNVANTLVSEAPRPMSSLGPMNYNTDNFYGYTTKTENSTITPNVDTSTYGDIMSNNIISDKGDTNLPIDFEVKPNTVLDTTSIDINNANQVTEDINYTHSFAFRPTTDIQSHAFATEPAIITQFIAETNKSNLTLEEYGNEIIISTTESSNINKIQAKNTILYTTTEQSIDNVSKVQKLLLNDLITTEGGKMDSATVDNTSISTITTTDQTNTVKVGNTTTPKSAINSKEKPDRTMIYPITTTESSKVNKIKTETLMNPIVTKVGNTLPIEVGYVPSFRGDERSSMKEIELGNAKTESKGLNLALKSSAPEYITEKSVSLADISIATMNPITDISTSGPMKTENITEKTDAISLVKAITEDTTLTATVINDTNDPKIAMDEVVKMKDAHEFIFEDKKGPGENSRLNKVDTANSKSEINPTITTTIEKGNPMVNTFMPTKTSTTGAEPPATVEPPTIVNESTFKQVFSSPVIYKTETSQSQFIPSTTEIIETQTVYRDKIQTLLEVPEATIKQSQTILNRMAISTSTPTANADDSRILRKQTINQNNTSKGMEATTEQNKEHRLLSTTSAPNGRYKTNASSILIQETVHPNYSLSLPKETEATTESEQYMMNEIPSSTSAPTYKLSTDDSLSLPKVSKTTTESVQYKINKITPVTSAPTYKLSTDDSSKLVQETVHHDDTQVVPEVKEATTVSEQNMLNRISTAYLTSTGMPAGSSKLIQETVYRDGSLTLPKVSKTTTETVQYKINKITPATSAPTYKHFTDDSSKLVHQTEHHDDTQVVLKVKEATTIPEQNTVNRILSVYSTSTGKPDDSSKLIQETVYHDGTFMLPEVTNVATDPEENTLNRIPSAPSIPNVKPDNSSKLIQETLYRDGSLTLPKVTEVPTESDQYMINKITSATSTPTNKLSTDDSSKLMRETLYHDDTQVVPKVKKATTIPEQNTVYRISSVYLTSTGKPDGSSKLIQKTVYHDGTSMLPKVIETSTESVQYMINKITSAISAPAYKVSTDDSSKLTQETLYHDDTQMMPKVREATTVPEQNTLNRIPSAYLSSTGKPDDSSTIIQQTVHRDDSLSLPKVTETTTESVQYMINKITSATSPPTYKLSTDDSSKLIQETVYRDDSLTLLRVNEATTESEQYMINKMTSATSAPTSELSTDNSSKLIQETVYRDSSLTLPNVTEATTESEQYMINKMTFATSAPTYKLSTDDLSKLIQETVNRDDSLSLPKVTESEQYMINKISTTTWAPNKLFTHDSSILLQQETVYHGDTLMLPKVTNVATDPKHNTLNSIPSAPSTSNEKHDDSSKLIQLTGSRDETLTLTKVTQATIEPKQNMENIVLSTILVPTGTPETENSYSYKVIQKAVHNDDTLTLSEGTAATVVPEESILNQISSTTLAPPSEPETVDSSKSIQKTAYRDEIVKLTTVEEVTLPKQNTQNIILSTILVPNGNSNIEDSNKFIQETVHSNDTLTLPRGTVATAVPEKSILNIITSTTLAPPSEPDTADSIKLIPQSINHGNTTAMPVVATVLQENILYRIMSAGVAPSFQPNTDNSSRLIQQAVLRGETLKLQNITEVTPKPKLNMPNIMISAATSTPGGKPDTDDPNKLTITGTRYLRSSLVSNNTQKIYTNAQSKTISDTVTKPTSTIETVNINDHKTMREPIPSNMNVSEVIFINGTVNNYSSQLRKKSPENVTTDQAMLQKSTVTQNITLTSKIASYLSNREDMNLETRNDTMTRAQINVDTGADKNVSNFSIQEKYDSSPSNLEDVPQLELTSPSPLVDSENPVKNTKYLSSMVTANGASYNRMHMVNPLILASDNTTSRKTSAENKSNRVYSSVNASMPVFDKDNEQANNNEQSNITKTKVEESISYHNLTKQPNSFNDNSKQQVYTVYAPDKQTYSTSNQQTDPVNREKKLTNVNTYTDFTASNNESNISNTAISFDCQSHTRGKYADNKDCRKFYICLGKLQPIVGTCPSNTVFSEINKQCTRNLSHCVRNNQFHCLYEGRFSDFFKDNIYYICVKNNLHGFYRYKLQCVPGYHLNKDTVKCAKDDEIITHSASSVSERSQSNNDEIKTTLKSKEGEKSENDFKCKEEGKFPHSKDCRKYYVCSKNKKKEYRRKIKKCSDDEVYDKKNEKCTSAESNEC